MKVVKICLLLVVGFSLMKWVREGTRFHPAASLPLMDGRSLDIVYTGASIALCLITLWGVTRLRARGR